jgi:CubicO group peptidase (beta-lactamase class C family)
LFTIGSVQANPDELRQRLEPLFQENFTRYGEVGAAVSLWQNGKSVLELHGGFRDARREQAWAADTLVLVWSATKGIGSACLLHALQQNRIELSRRVAEFWPEFAQNGKTEITIATLLSHAAGVCALDETVDVLDYPAIIAALEKQAPLWAPGTTHGYHARTFGFMVDELTRRIAGISISRYWRTQFAEPLHLDFWIGLPNDLNSRVATICPAKAGRAPEPAQFYRALDTPGTLQRRVFTSPQGLYSVSPMNKPEIRAQPIVSFGGIGSATALAKFYGLLANDGCMDGRRYFNPQTIAQMSTVLCDGIDMVFDISTAFSAGFMMDSASTPRRIFGPTKSSFGHPGAGGSHAYADPANGIGFAYVMNQMELSVLPTQKALRLVDAIYNSKLRPGRT